MNVRETLSGIRRKPLLLALALLAVGGTALGAWYLKRESRPRPLSESGRAAFLAELQPVTLKNCTLRRFGSANDGGYLMCDNLSEGVQSSYSYGVGSNDDFACDVSKRYRVPAHQYDCFDPARPVCQGGDFRFNNECIASHALRDKEGRVFDSLKNQVARNGDTGKRLIVKIDIEGAEWESLLATPDAVLDQIDQLAMELHVPAGATTQHLNVVRRLKRKFHVVNLHFNNFACVPGMKPLPSWAFQVLLVNKRLGAVDPAAPVPAPMSPLNAPDNPQGPDCQL